ELNDVSVIREKQALLSHINLHIHCGQLTALIGQNGAGKTTLLKAILGEIPYTGAVRHQDYDNRTMPKITVGYVPQHLDFDKDAPITVEDFLACGLTRRPVWTGISKKTRLQVMDALEKVQAQSLGSSSLGKLSGGELQRVLLAMAITPQPDLLVLDEPVSGIDRKGLSMFLDTVSNLRRHHHMAILLVSHDLPLVQKYADNVILLDKEVLMQGTPEEVFSSQTFHQVFGFQKNESAFLVKEGLHE
ncbi:MAG: metal ABC transporter ATP-binding protein, partial [Clostridiales bacterium]|nr:metal ABC transporter ATP-binding protein [Clostridiales bacterium]